MSRIRTLVLAALVVALVPNAATAQGVGSPDTGRGWAPVLVGLRAGYDSQSTRSVVGAQIHLPVLPSGYVELIPNGSITFLTGLKEYQTGVEAVAVSGGAGGGIYAGGGLGWRSTIYGDATRREWRSSPTVVVGARTGNDFGPPLGAQIEVRWVFLDGPYTPRVLTMGVNFPLWGHVPGRGRR